MKIRINAQAQKYGQLKRFWASVAAHYRRFAARVDFVFRILSSAFKNSALDTPNSTVNPDNVASVAQTEQNEINGSAESQHPTTNAEHRTSNEEPHLAHAVLTSALAQQNTLPWLSGGRNEQKGAGKSQASTFNGEFQMFGPESASPANAEIRQRDVHAAGNPPVAELLAEVYCLQQSLSGYARNHVTQEELGRELASLRRLIETKGK